MPRHVRRDRPGQLHRHAEPGVAGVEPAGERARAGSVGRRPCASAGRRPGPGGTPRAGSSGCRGRSTGRLVERDDEVGAQLVEERHHRLALGLGQRRGPRVVDPARVAAQPALREVPVEVDPARVLRACRGRRRPGSSWRWSRPAPPFGAARRAHLPARPRARRARCRASGRARAARRARRPGPAGGPRWSGRSPRARRPSPMAPAPATRAWGPWRCAASPPRRCTSGDDGDRQPARRLPVATAARQAASARAGRPVIRRGYETTGATVMHRPAHGPARRGRAPRAARRAPPTQRERLHVPGLEVERLPGRRPRRRRGPASHTRSPTL